MEKKYKATYVLFGLILMVGLTMATTTISDTGSTYDGNVVLTNSDIYLDGISADITSSDEIDLFPNDQTVNGIRVSTNLGENYISSLGSTNLYFQDKIYMPYSASVTGNLAVTGGNIQLHGNLEMDTNGDIVMSGSSSDITTDDSLDIYPQGQTINGLNIDYTGGYTQLSARGSTNIAIDDNLILKQGLDVAGDVDSMEFAVDKGIKFHALDSDTLGTDEQSISFYGDDPSSKPYLAWHTWYDTDQGAGITMDDTWSGWIGCHYNTSITPDAHQHCSWETMDTDTGYANTRFALDYGKPVSDIFATFSGVNAVKLQTGVDLRFYQTGTLKGNLLYNDTNSAFEALSPNEISIKPNGQTTDGLNIYSVGGDTTLQDISGNELYFDSNVFMQGTTELWDDTSITGELLVENEDTVRILNDASTSEPSYLTGTVLSLVRNPTASTSSGLSIVSGATSGASYIALGDADDADVGKIEYTNSDNKLSFYAGTGKKLIVDVGSVTIDSALKLTPRASPPFATEGMLYMDSDTHELCVYTGSAWVGLVAGGVCA